MLTVSIKLSNVLAQTVTEMAKMRSISVENFLTQLADATAAAHRLQAYKPAPRISRSQGAGAAANPDLPVGRRKELTAEQTQKILHLNSELTVNQLAKRFGTSSSNVRRILETYERALHNNLVTGRTGRPAHSRPLTLTNSERAQP
jgi:hypothetical protein